jgi:hypothetical protein
MHTSLVGTMQRGCGDSASRLTIARSCTRKSIVEVGAGAPRRLAGFSDSDSVVPTWSRDGQWVYFASNRGGHIFHLWKVPVGGGSLIQVTSRSGFRLPSRSMGPCFTRSFQVQTL